MTILYIISALAACFLALAVWALSSRSAALARARELSSAAADLEARLADSAARYADLTESASSKEIAQAARIADLTARLEATAARAESEKAEMEKLQGSFRLEFRNMANDILEEKARRLGEESARSIDSLLKPFSSSIAAFKDRVEAIYADENRQRGALQNEIKNLHELNRRITEETTNLTNALKGNSKVQGDWGEMILQTLLEHSNLVAGIHFTTQTNLKDAEGNNLRPDVVLNLPGQKQIVIDSKVSLTAYAGYCSDCPPADRERLLREHIASVRKHVDELGRKSYQDLIAASPDFVIMFIPNEPAYLCAMQADSAIWTDAYNKKVIVSSPTNLLALLKIVDELWRRDDQSRNALEIADEGAKLYDKFAGFVDTLEALGKTITSAGLNYDKAMKQLSTGTGSLVARTEKLRTLGVRTRKQLGRQMLEKAGQEPDGEDSEVES